VHSDGCTRYAGDGGEIPDELLGTGYPIVAGVVITAGVSVRKGLRRRYQFGSRAAKLGLRSRRMRPKYTGTGMDIRKVARAAKAFEETLAATKARLAPADFWYRYGSLGNFSVLNRLLTGDHRDLNYLADRKPIADIGGGDGDCAFFLETLGCRAQLIENRGTNHNRLQGAHMIKEALSSSVEITDVDLDRQFLLPERRYGLVLLLGVLYHLKNPYYVLETLSRHARHCLLSTRVARFSPDGTYLHDIPVAYLVDERELNNDPTNYWIFSHAGLQRLISRSGWEIADEFSHGDTTRSDPASPDRDERSFLLLRSTRRIGTGGTAERRNADLIGKTQTASDRPPTHPPLPSSGSV
jgi:tRNA (mo5U34)-methyltransferase